MSFGQLCRNSADGHSRVNSLRLVRLTKFSRARYSSCTCESAKTTRLEFPSIVGNDRSRTWVISRTAEGLHLKHEHSHEDGSEEEITQYGGDTSTSGSRSRQDFPADSHTASLVSTAANNIWGIEIRAGRTFVYSLRNGTTNRRVRLEFNLAEPIEELPPPPWGA